MSTRTVPQYSTRELQAAAQALTAGRFAAGSASTSQTAQPASPHAQVMSGLTPASSAPAAAATDQVDVTASAGLAPLVRVRAASAGAGASTIALALAECAAAGGVRARVLDAAAPAWSGLLGATVTELGAADGWRRGRRSSGVLVDRVEEPVRVASEVPVPRELDGIELTVLDAGWSMRELVAAESTGWVAASTADVEVLVTRPTTLALSQTETALAHLEDLVFAARVAVVVVGAGRWSEREFAAAGRHLRHVREQEGLLFGPVLPAKTLPGLGPDPLPKQLTNPSQRLLERITTITGPLTANPT